MTDQPTIIPRTSRQGPASGPHVVIIGGGVIGVELASALTSFGSEVTIVEALPRLVAAEDEAISKALARQLQASYVDLKHFNPKQNLINLLPEAQARRFRAVVLDEVNGRLQVGFVDPTDLQAYDDVVRLLRRDIELAVVAESQLLALVDRVYRRTEEITGLAKELTADLGDVPVEFGDLLGAATGAEEAPVVKLLQTVFEEAMRARLRHPHRAAGSILARAFPYRRCPARADGG